MIPQYNYLYLCQKGYRSKSPLECHYGYGSSEYQAWMLGYWLWITVGEKPRDLTEKSDCLWIVDKTVEIQWLGVYDDQNKREVRERKDEFIRQN